MMLVLSIVINGYAQTVTIGTQVWSTTNLDVSSFRNGDPIPQAKTKEGWKKADENGEPAWCYYNNDPLNGEKYGKLYNWYAVSDPRGLAPEGWHIPSSDEVYDLIKSLGNKEDSVGAKLKSTEGWNQYENLNENDEPTGTFRIGNGNNESGFQALPGGMRQRGINQSIFMQIGSDGHWWTATEFVVPDATYFCLRNSTDSITLFDLNFGVGLSVRCMQD